MARLCQSRDFQLVILCHKRASLHSQSNSQEAMSQESAWICWYHQTLFSAHFESVRAADALHLYHLNHET